MNELEEILDLLGVDQLAKVSKTLFFTNLARCLDLDHFEVVERALFRWNSNEHLINSDCLSQLNAQQVLPIIYGPLRTCTRTRIVPDIGIPTLKALPRFF